MDPSVMLDQRSPDSSSSRSPSKFEWRASVLTTLGVIAALLSVALRLAAPGWLILLCGIPLLIAAIIHVVVHALGALRLAAGPGSPAWLFLLSDLLCLLGFGLQPDFGDAPGFYFGLYNFWSLFAHIGNAGSDLIDVDRWFNLVNYTSIACLLGLAATWVIILVRSRRPKKEAVVEPA